ncbi:MAG: alkaline phosphatase family protein [Candidatus Acidiferrales bacterium]
MRRALLKLLLLAAIAAMATVPPVAAQESPTPRPRLVQIKVDGLSPLLLDALMDPDDPEKLGRLPDPEGFRRAIELFRIETGQRDLLPNLRRYFYDEGVRAGEMYSATMTLSAVAWGVIETGQPSVVKRHMTFNRNNGYLRGHLDGFRDTMEIIVRRSRKTSALWELDQAGVSLFSDAFNPLRRYELPQIFYRLPPRDYLVGWASTYATAGESLSHPWRVVRGHLKRRVEGMDYPDFSEEFHADHIAEKILEPEFNGEERYDYITAFFTLDHQMHVDPNPENLVHRMARLDRRLGRIFRGVERSRRRDSTLITLISDHGSEFLPGAVNLAFPITRAFRTRYFGGHTVTTVMAEDAGRALSNPIPGIDFPRTYESPFSPYGKDAGGESGYVTAFIDNFGNARAEVHLRNNDLNRLHLLLLARKRPLDAAEHTRSAELMRATLADACRWLEPELANYRAYHEGGRAWIPSLEKRADYFWRDVAARLKDEGERDAQQLAALERLQELCQAEDPASWLAAKKPSVSDLIPKRYFGPRNSVFQLSHYSIGLDDNLDWVETTVDVQGRPAPMDYVQLLSDYRAPNPPLSNEANPTDLIVTLLPVEPVAAALAEHGWLSPDSELARALWVVSTAKNNLRKGGQALLLEDKAGRLRYLPMENLQETADGRFLLAPHNELDPLGLFYDSAFRSPTGEPAFLWLEEFHTAEDWLAATHGTAYTIAPLIFADLAGVHAERFIGNPEFQQTLNGFASEEAKQRYLRGLAWKYASQEPDLLLWSSYLWNYSSKSHTSGGSHGGLTPQVTRTTFLLWGGRNFHLPAGEVLDEPATTLDIAPTLARLLGMLDNRNRMLHQAGAARERTFLPFPGRALLAPEVQFARPAQQPPVTVSGAPSPGHPD